MLNFDIIIKFLFTNNGNFNGNTSLKTMTLYFEVEKYENLRSDSLLFLSFQKRPRKDL